MPNAVGMLYIYLSLILSAALCFIGVVLSIVDVNKYNFGLYLALLSIVTFTVALACFVVKPKVCMGPFCLTKLIRQIRLLHGRFQAVNTHEECADRNCHEQLQQKRSITEVMLYKKQESQQRDVEVVEELIDFQLTTTGSIAQMSQKNTEERTGSAEDMNKMDNGNEYVEQSTLSPKRLRFVDELDKVTKTSGGRHRAWTVSCSSNLKRESAFFRKQRENNTANQYNVLPRLIMCQDPHLLMHTAWPLRERGPLLAAIPGIARKSYSHEEVIDLSSYYRSESNKSNNTSNNHLNDDDNNFLGIGTRHMSFITHASKAKETSTEKTLSPYKSWRRSRTIVVKYVPVRSEWLPKAGSPVQYSSEVRERSHSSCGLEMTSSENENSSQISAGCTMHMDSKRTVPSQNKLQFLANFLRPTVNRVNDNPQHNTETLV